MNRIFARRDELSSNRRGDFVVKTVRPDKPEHIAVRAGPHRMGQIIIRFVVLLAIVVGLLLLAWLL